MKSILDKSRNTGPWLGVFLACMVGAAAFLAAGHHLHHEDASDAAKCPICLLGAAAVLVVGPGLAVIPTAGQAVPTRTPSYRPFLRWVRIPSRAPPSPARSR